MVKTVPGEDERSHVRVVTAKGKRLLEKGVVAWRKSQKQTAALVGEDGVEAIHRLAEKMFRRKVVVVYQIIVPLKTLTEGVLPRIKKTHDL